MKVMSNNPDMLEEYNFSKGVRGKYAKEYKKGTNVVFIDPEVADFAATRISHVSMSAKCDEG